MKHSRITFYFETIHSDSRGGLVPKKTFIHVNLEEKFQYFVELDANSSDENKRANLLINTMWQICGTM